MKHAALPLFTLLAEVLVFHGHILFTSRYTVAWDLREYHQPLAEFMARCLRNGALPLWDPYTYCGLPFYANLQTQFGYPPAWATAWLSNLAGGGRLLDFLEWEIALHVFLGGAFTYWLLRRIGLDRASATLGGTIFQLGAFFASQTQHLGAVCAGAWLPAAWLAVFALAEGCTWRRLAGLAGAIAMAALAGFPAATVVVAGSSFLLAVCLAALRQASVRLPLFATAACLWAALLGAFELLPAM